MALLEATGMTVRRGGRLTLDGAALSCGAGEIVGVIGPNGAGKTTLLDALGGLVPCSGAVVLDDLRLDRLTPDGRARRGLGRTFQEPRLVAGATVRDALLAGCHARMHTGLVRDLLRLPGGAREETRAAAETLRTATLLGITDLLDRPAGSLSLGAARLVELGRALCAAPRVLLLDEPFSGTDTAEAAAITATLRRLRDDGMAIVLVEHDVEVILGLCDFVHVLDGGRPIARGRPTTVHRDPVVVAAWLGPEADHGVSAGPPAHGHPDVAVGR